MELWELNKMEEQVQNTASKKKGVKTFFKIFIVLIIIAATAFAVWKILGSKKQGGFPGGFGGFGGGRSTVTSVRTVVTKKDTLHDYVLTNGEIETQSAIEVFSSFHRPKVYCLYLCQDILWHINLRKKANHSN